MNTRIFKNIESCYCRYQGSGFERTSRTNEPARITKINKTHFRGFETLQFGRKVVLIFLISLYFFLFTTCKEVAGEV